MKCTRRVILTVVAALVLVIGSAGIVSAAKPTPWLTAHLYSVAYDTGSGKTSVHYAVNWADYRRMASYDMTIHNDTDDREVKHLAVAFKESSGGWDNWVEDPVAGDHSGDTYTITMTLFAKNGAVLATTTATFPVP